jgi:hypothetical protein
MRGATLPDLLYALTAERSGIGLRIFKVKVDVLRKSFVVRTCPRHLVLGFSEAEPLTCNYATYNFNYRR